MKTGFIVIGDIQMRFYARSNAAPGGTGDLIRRCRIVKSTMVIPANKVKAA